MKACAVITPGHCASSFMMHQLGKAGYKVGPPGPPDKRHPTGKYDWMDLLGPQIQENWDGYVQAIAKEQGAPFAFKLQSGIIHWGIEAVKALPQPCRVIILDRAEVRKITKRISPNGDQWLWDFSRALARLIPDLMRASIPFEFYTKEEICKCPPTFE